MIRYEVIESADKTQLQNEIESRIRLDWKLVGGISIAFKSTSGSNTKHYAQAMTRELQL